jgi:hypothetical protein
MNDNDDKLERLIRAYRQADRQHDELVRAAMLAAVPGASELDIMRAIRVVAEEAVAEAELDLMRDRMN